MAKIDKKLKEVRNTKKEEDKMGALIVGVIALMVSGALSIIAGRLFAGNVVSAYVGMIVLVFGFVVGPVAYSFVGDSLVMLVTYMGAALVPALVIYTWPRRVNHSVR